MKKMIPALCMLLVAAALMGTSTFAWFSMNSTVTATGMTVKAKASSNLLISRTNADTGFLGSVSMSSDSNDVMSPVSTVGGNVAAPKFYTLDERSGMKQDDASRVESTVKDATGSEYLKTTVWIKSVGAAATNLNATIYVSEERGALDASLRVMLVVKAENKTYIYTPIDGSEYLTEGQAISSLGNDNKGVLSAVTSLKDDGDTILENMAADTAYEVDIYIWYEGEDKACTAANTSDLKATTFDISFTATPVAQ